MGFLSDTVGGIAGAGMGLLGDVVGGLGLGGPAPMLQQPFAPMNVSGPFGNISFEDGTLNMGMSPEMQARNQFFNQQLGQGFNLSPNQQAFQNQAGLFGNQAAGLGAQQGMFQRGMGGALGGFGMGALGAAGNMDPNAIAANQFQQMQNLVAPGREQQRLASEGRSLRQGLLGSTAGKNRSAALETGFGQQDAKFATNALQQGRSFQDQLFRQGLGATQAGSGMFGQGTRAEIGGMSTGLGFMGQGLNQDQIARSNFFQNLQGQQGLQQGLFNMANLAMTGGQQQQAVSNANVAAQNAHAQAQSDATMGLLMGGAQMFMGMPPISAMGGSPATALGGFGGMGAGGVAPGGSFAPSTMFGGPALGAEGTGFATY